jgi:hypothetical protein
MRLATFCIFPIAVRVIFGRWWLFLVGALAKSWPN